MEITILGSGTSMGVPILGHDTPVARSKDPRDKRLRSSVLITKEETMVIDTGPDFRTQMLNNQVMKVDRVLYTHHHYDHIGGLDDLRPLTHSRKDPIEIYCHMQTYDDIIRRYPYLNGNGNKSFHPLSFNPHQQQDGLLTSFIAGEFSVQPIECIHVRSAAIISTGYVIDKKFGYLTDLIEIKEGYEPFLSNLELLVIGAPLPFPHENHISIYQAEELLQKFSPEQGLITHLGDRLFHEELEARLAPPLGPAYDNQKFIL